MWELDCEETWEPKNWCFWNWCWRRLLESPLDCKEIQPVHSKGDQPWVFFGRNDAEAETAVPWPPHAKSWLIGKDSDAGRDWGQEEKGTTEDEMAGCHHWLSGHEFEWTPGVGDEQEGLACCDSWGLKESDTTERLNWTELNWTQTKAAFLNGSLQVQLSGSDFSYSLHNSELIAFRYIAKAEKAMAPHSSSLAWKIPWTEEPGRLQSMGSLKVRHDWVTLLSLFTFMHWRRKWQPIPVFLPGESQGQGSLVGCCLLGRTESDMTEAT